jgi:DNA-binding IclR family transcriptional regulator
MDQMGQSQTTGSPVGQRKVPPWIVGVGSSGSKRSPGNSGQTVDRVTAVLRALSASADDGASTTTLARSAARAAVHRLATSTGESAFYSVRRADETVVLPREDGSFPVRSFVLFEGARFPLGVVSAGLAILAYLADDEIADYLGRTDLTVDYTCNHSAEAIRTRVAATREHGWSLNPGLIVEGSWGMAAAVFRDNAPIAALTLTGVATRFRPERQAALGQALLREAHALTLEEQRSAGPGRRPRTGAHPPLA